MTDEKINLKDRILAEIKSGDVSMRPKVHFTLKLAALLLLSAAVVGVTVLVFNFIAFSIRIGSQETLLHFGPRGFTAFLFFFPWRLLALDALLLILLQMLLRSFRFAVKIPILYLLAALLIVTALLGLGIDRATVFNDRLSDHRDTLPPPFRTFYIQLRRQEPRGSGVCKCTILAINGNKLTVEDAREHEGAGEATTTLTVILPFDDAHATTTGLRVGDTIYIAGEETDGVIQAFGVRRMEMREGMQGR